METRISRGDAESAEFCSSPAKRGRGTTRSVVEGAASAVWLPAPSTASRSPSPVNGGGAVAGDIIAIARTWIGTPYIHQASVKGAGCDCLGLLRGVWRELHGEEPEDLPAYSPDWAEATGRETLRDALARHLTGIDRKHIAPGDIAVFRMTPRGPAKHCGIVAERNCVLTLIHARQNKRVSEEVFSTLWWRKLAFAFRLPHGQGVS